MPSFELWFALTDDERIVPLGLHQGFSSADDVAPGNTVWLFDKQSLIEMKAKIDEALMPKASPLREPLPQPVPESVHECEFGDDEYQWRLRQAGL